MGICFCVAGAVHARDFRTAGCIAVGNGSTLTTLDINLVASEGAPDYCGVLVNNVSIDHFHSFFSFFFFISPKFRNSSTATRLYALGETVVKRGQSARHGPPAGGKVGTGRARQG